MFREFLMKFLKSIQDILDVDSISPILFQVSKHHFILIDEVNTSKKSALALKVTRNVARIVSINVGLETKEAHPERKPSFLRAVECPLK